MGKIKEPELTLKGDDFIPNDERIDIILELCVKNCGLKGDLRLMHEMWQRIWVDAPLYDDVKPFFESSPLPIYILSNDDLIYLEQSMEKKDLRPAAIIQTLGLRAPIYRQLAAYGHVGREDLGVKWEETDKKDELRDRAGL